MRVGIICEGMTDYHVLKNIISSFSHEEIEFQPIQPCLDATEKFLLGESYGGWELVQNYLQSNHFEESVVNTELLIIQIDTDVCEHPKFLGSQISLANTNHDQFYAEIKSKLIEWIDSYESGIYDYYKDKIVFAISVHSLECWILANYSSKRSKITNCITELCITLNKQKKPFNTREKDIQEYIEYSKFFRKNRNHSKVKSKSQSFSIFVDELTKKMPNI